MYDLITLVLILSTLVYAAQTGPKRYWVQIADKREKRKKARNSTNYMKIDIF